MLHYVHKKINPDREGSYLDSPIWLKNKKATTNHKNNNEEKCFHYALTIALSHEQIKSNPQRISDIRHFIINTTVTI